MKTLNLSKRVADFVKKEKADFWNELSLSEQNEIIKGIEELDNGKRVTYESFIKKISKWKYSYPNLPNLNFFDYLNIYWKNGA